jgi:hypothetical protein
MRYWEVIFAALTDVIKPGNLLFTIFGAKIATMS